MIYNWPDFSNPMPEGVYDNSADYSGMLIDRYSRRTAETFGCLSFGTAPPSYTDETAVVGPVGDTRGHPGLSLWKAGMPQMQWINGIGLNGFPFGEPVVANTNLLFHADPAENKRDMDFWVSFGNATFVLVGGGARPFLLVEPVTYALTISWVRRLSPSGDTTTNETTVNLTIPPGIWGYNGDEPGDRVFVRGKKFDVWPDAPAGQTAEFPVLCIVKIDGVAAGII